MKECQVYAIVGAPEIKYRYSCGCGVKSPSMSKKKAEQWGAEHFAETEKAKPE